MMMATTAMKREASLADGDTSRWHAIVAAPFFALGAQVSDTFVTRLVFLPPTAARPGDMPMARRVFGALEAWLQDPAHDFDLPLMAAGTVFQRRVWAEIAGIPYGCVVSYGELAERLHSAPRAVGAACGMNPLPVFVPCHRVIAKDGRLGGFNRATNGLMPTIKRWLLMRENPARAFA
jgi:methylated-DNA-[protein]-cysteine S-methyltransferase